MIRLSWILSLLVGCILASCVPAVDRQEIVFDYSIDDPIVRRILDFQISQQTDSLTYYLGHANPNYRYTATLSFASFQDDRALPLLYERLQDSLPQVASMAAYSLGQFGPKASVSRLMSAFHPDDSIGRFDELNMNILEATGKCGGKQELELLSSISTYRTSDTSLLIGQTRGIYQFMLREVVSENGSRCMATYLLNKNMPKSVRLAAANYFFRARNISIDEYLYSFKKLLQEEKDARIRMCVALPLARQAGNAMIPSLIDIWKSEKDYRVQANMIRGLSGKRNPLIERGIFEKLPELAFPVQLVASEYLISSGSGEGSVSYYDYAEQSDLPLPVKANLLAASLTHLPFYYTITRNNVTAALKRYLLENKDAYDKIRCYNALASDPLNIGFLHGQWKNAEDPVLKSAIVQAITQAFQHLEDAVLVRDSKRSLTATAAQSWKEAVISADAGAAALGAGAIRAHWAQVSGFISDTAFLHQTLSKLSLPAELETYQEIEKTIAHIENDTYDQKVPFENVAKINWEAYDDLPSIARVIVLTTRGNFTIALFKEEAPLSVLNFLRLAKEDFFNDKSIHRMVPNFVIQTGCPRGDGFGSLDYTIRSEVSSSRYWKEGMVGMASAGAHTECSQWFVTHSPTPHLDGRYTVFGEVSDGMEVVHDCRIGDKIISIKILD